MSKMMDGQLYESVEGKYDLPIFDHDNAVSAYDWRYLIDTYVANYGHNTDRSKFKKHIREFLRMITEDVNDPVRDDGYYDVCISGDSCIGIWEDITKRFIKRMC